VQAVRHTCTKGWWTCSKSFSLNLLVTLQVCDPIEFSSSVPFSLVIQGAYAHRPPSSRSILRVPSYTLVWWDSHLSPLLPVCSIPSSTPFASKSQATKMDHKTLGSGNKQFLQPALTTPLNEQSHRSFIENIFFAGNGTDGMDKYRAILS